MNPKSWLRTWLTVGASLPFLCGTAFAKEPAQPKNPLAFYDDSGRILYVKGHIDNRAEAADPRLSIFDDLEFVYGRKPTPAEVSTALNNLRNVTGNLNQICTNYIFAVDKKTGDIVLVKKPEPTQQPIPAQTPEQPQSTQPAQPQSAQKPAPPQTAEEITRMEKIEPAAGLSLIYPEVYHPEIYTGLKWQNFQEEETIASGGLSFLVNSHGTNIRYSISGTSEASRNESLERKSYASSSLDFFNKWFGSGFEVRCENNKPVMYVSGMLGCGNEKVSASVKAAIGTTKSKDLRGYVDANLVCLTDNFTFTLSGGGDTPAFSNSTENYANTIFKVGKPKGVRCFFGVGVSAEPLNIDSWKTAKNITLGEISDKSHGNISAGVETSRFNLTTAVGGSFNGNYWNSASAEAKIAYKL